ncbi:MAG: hypothetical protein RLZZ628_2474 [Bacteroidota bacterium]|jgi:hypothetical protein
MSTRLTAFGNNTLKNRFNALTSTSQTKFIDNFYSTDKSILNALDNSAKPTFQNWKNWAEGLTGTKLAGAPTATSTVQRYYYYTTDLSRVDHSDIGEFPLPKNPHLSLEPAVMESGGHGQRNLDYLAAMGWDFKIIKTWANGVRVGYILRHSDPSKNGTLNASGIPQSGQSWFPASWTTKDIQSAGNFVFTSNKAAFTALPNGGMISGKYFGVKVIIQKTLDQAYLNDIGSIFPDVNQ